MPVDFKVFHKNVRFICILINAVVLGTLLSEAESCQLSCPCAEVAAFFFEMMFCCLSVAGTVAPVLYATV